MTLKLNVSVLLAVFLCTGAAVSAGSGAGDRGLTLYDGNEAVVAPADVAAIAHDDVSAKDVMLRRLARMRSPEAKDRHGDRVYAGAFDIAPPPSIDVTVAASNWRPCELECPPGGTAEGEPDCGQPYDTVNGGCLLDPPLFSSISCDETVCGTAEWNGSIRDTDWYEVVIGEPMILTLTVEAEFGVVIGLLEQEVLGVPGCGNLTGYLIPYAILDECVEDGIVTGCLWPGTYYLFIAPDFNGPTFACGADYLATLTCEPCTLPIAACCMRDGTCVNDTTPYDCMIQGGTYQGDGTNCGMVSCPQPQSGDYCPIPLPVDLPGDLPYDDLDQDNCGRLNDYDETCLGIFDGGEEIIYELSVTTAVNILITLDPKDTEYTGILLDDSCPPDLDCIATSVRYDAVVHDLGCKHLEPGTYYIMVDTWPAPYCIPEFDLSIETCVPPTGRCCYEPWPICVDGLTEWECQTGYDGRFTPHLNCTAHPCPMPVPESCAEAFTINSVPYEVLIDNDEATADGPAASCDPYSATGNMRNDAWFAWTADDDCFGEITVTPEAYDAILVAWEGPNCGSLVEVDCVDTPEPLVYQFTAVTGTTYWFQIGDTGAAEEGGLTTIELTCSDTGAGACCFEDGSCSDVTAAVDCVDAGGYYWGEGTDCGPPNPCPQPQPGDDCDTPLFLTLPGDGLPYVDDNTTCGHGNDYDETCLGNYDGGEDIIYELTLTDDRCLDIQVDSTDPGWITAGVVIDTVCPPGGTCLAFDTDPEGDPRLMVELTAGTYWIMFDTWPSPICTAFTMTIDDCPPIPLNDHCTSLKEIGDTTGLAFDTTRATFDGAGTCMYGPNIWYCYTADYTGSIDVSLCGSTYDTKLAVYEGCTCNPLGTELGCNDDYDCAARSLQSQLDDIPVRAGQEYLIEVGGHGSNTGPGELAVTSDPDPLGRCCYDPWPNCVDDIAELDCELIYNGWFREGLNCTDDPCPEPFAETCDEALVVTHVPFTTTIDNGDATADGPAASCDPYGHGGAMHNDAWYSWTADADCFGEITVTAEDYEVVMVAWEGPDCDNLVELGCVFELLGKPLVFQWAAVTGTTYWFQIGDPGGAEGGGLTTIDMTCSSPGNGACCFEGGSCSVMVARDCAIAGGFYWGEGTDCDPNPCPQPASGDDCDTPLSVVLPADGIPYVDLHNTTCGHGNNYEDTCLDDYDGGEDIMYKLTLTMDMCLNISADSICCGWICGGIALDTVCPPGNPCLESATDPYGDPSMQVSLTAGTYYLMFDNWPSPTCVEDFTLTITTCVPPVPGDFDFDTDVDLDDYDSFEECFTGPDGGPFGPGCWPGDFDDDDDIDCDDWEAFKLAWTGPPTDPPFSVNCDADCNGNGVVDEYDIASGTSQDCQGNGVPDECEIDENSTAPGGPFFCVDNCDPDCNDNGVPDECDVVNGTSEDCNINDIPDECDIAEGTSQDCQPNEVPDECDIAEGTSMDANQDGVPDECAPPIVAPLPENSLGITDCTTDEDCADKANCVDGTCYVPKHRYISIARNSEQVEYTARRISLQGDGAGPWWVGTPYQASGFTVADVVDDPEYVQTWPDLVNVMGCEIAPNQTYLVQAIAEGQEITEEANYSTAIALHTPEVWGDVVSTCMYYNCDPPQGEVNIDDILAVIGAFQSLNNDPLTWFDIAPALGDGVPNQMVDIDDILATIQGFQSKLYPGLGPLDCP